MTKNESWSGSGYSGVKMLWVEDMHAGFAQKAKEEKSQQDDAENKYRNTSEALVISGFRETNFQTIRKWKKYTS